MRNINIRKTIFRILVLTILMGGLCTIGYTSHADAAAKDLTLKAGFYGGPYYELENYTYAEMCSMAERQVRTYSGIDDGNFIRICYAWGVPLETLIEHAGIDLNSVKYLHMGTTDSYGETFSTFSADSLLQTRYFYPHLIDVIEDGDPQIGDYSVITSKITQGKKQVPTILAVGCTDFKRENAIKASKDGYKEYKSSDLSEDLKYRLIFGQNNLGGSPSSGAYNVRTSDKWIHEINVQLSGAPSIKVEKTLISGKKDEIGSKYEVTITASLPSSYSYLPNSILSSLRQQILENIQLGAYDESVAKVTKTGDGKYQVDIVGEGSTELNFSYSRKEYGGGTTSAGGSASLKGNKSGGDEGKQEEEEQKEKEEGKKEQEVQKEKKEDKKDEKKQEVQKKDDKNALLSKGAGKGKSGGQKNGVGLKDKESTKDQKKTAKNDKKVENSTKWVAADLDVQSSEKKGESQDLIDLDEESGGLGGVGVGVAIFFQLGMAGSIAGFLKSV